MVFVLAFVAVVGALVVPWWALVQAYRARREVRELKERLQALETPSGAEPPLAAVPPPGAAETSAPPSAAPLPEPVPFPGLAHANTEPPPAPAASPPLAPVVSLPATAAPAAPGPTTAAHAARRPFDSSKLEQAVAGIWLQNIGAVLLLLGVFFMILWGYTTGRLGPEALVGAGAAVGLVFAWRGDRMSRRLPAFGHAFIGIGLGVIYLSLYLGHFTLRVLPPWLAFGALTLVSFGSVAVGLRYKVQTIAVLGVVGAFVPQLMAAWAPLKGFTMTPAGMLAYLAVVDLVVFGLAARAGWSALALFALLLSAFVWCANFREPWGWPVEGGLSALFALLGLAPLPRLARTEGTVRPLDLAVVAVAPLALVASSWPLLAFANQVSVTILLFSLAILYLGAALWVDRRRPEQDLWRPLTGAATLFLTVALQRAVGRENTSMAWCVEGALLVALGLTPRGAWLRICGYAVMVPGVGWLLLRETWDRWLPAERGALPLVNPGAVRDLVSIAAVLLGAWALARGRERLSARERAVPEIWTGLGNLLLVLWGAAEASHLAFALEGPGGRWQHLHGVTAPEGNARLNSLTPALVSAAWLVQAMALLLLTVRPGRGFLRICGYAAAGLGVLALMSGLIERDGWSNDQSPVLYLAGLVNLACVLAVIVVAVRLARRRDRLTGLEQRAPEVWTAVASVMMLAWTAREADHVARALQGVPGLYGRFPADVSDAVLKQVRTLSASFTSAAWLVQAIVLIALGWRQGSAFLRWAGLALAGLTVLKFLLFDLQTVDVFWRFLGAVVVGAVLLAVSYAYQRRSRREQETA